MTSRRIWNEADIEKAIELVKSHGRSLIEMANPRDAINFRLAVYNYSRAKAGIPKLKIEVSGTDVIITEQEPMRRPVIIRGGQRSTANHPRPRALLGETTT